MRDVSYFRCFLFSLSLAAISCGGEDDNHPSPADPTDTGVLEPPSGTAVTSFESDGPLGSDSGGSNFGTGAREDTSAAAGSGAAAPGAAPEAANAAPTADSATATNAQSTASDNDDSGSEAARAITEADVIQLQGDKLYALSRVAGLAIIDVSQPSALRILGRYRELPAQPFEMYVRDGVVLAMFSGWGRYTKIAEDDYRWVTTSKLLALDTANPSAIRELSSFDVPGAISDSRIVGDVLYIVGHQDGYCWHCKEGAPRTSIVSLHVSDPQNVTQVDEQYYDDAGSWGAKSVAVTTSRLYVAGPEGNSDATGSTIQVIDISDPNGKLNVAARVSVEGFITNRWQMDEYEDVLRVISQPPQIWTGNGRITSDPTVETFRIASSTEFSKLGHTALRLPRPETLRSVRFDGPRAYAITAEQTDPLFTIDLSDPANPAQKGELELPGFISYLEPRGERLFGLGFDNQDKDGSLHVSLFDVKDLAAPVLIKRVNFGGDWASLPEDQDRIHKVFRVLPELGLVLVPYSGTKNVDERTTATQGFCSYRQSIGGVQLIDYQNDSLTLRGSTESDDYPRRALIAHDSLISVGDLRVEAYGIGDRNKPAPLSKIILAQYTDAALQLDNDVVARRSTKAGTGTPVFDFVASQDAGDANQRYAEIDVAALAGPAGQDASVCNSGLSLEQSLRHGSQLELLYNDYAYKTNGDNASSRGLLIVDAAQPQQPAVLSNTRWPLNDNDGNGDWSPAWDYYRYGYYGNPQYAVRTQSALAVLEQIWQYTDQGDNHKKMRLRVVDLRDPKNVKTSEVALDDNTSYSGVLADGATVFTSHFVPNEGQGLSGRGRFYLDRVDVSDPTSPRKLAAINVPGTLMHMLPGATRAITTEQVKQIVENVTPSACYERFANAEFEWPELAGAGVAVAGAAGAVSSAAAATGGSGGAAAAGVSTPASDAATPARAAADSGASIQDVYPPNEETKGRCIGRIQRLHLVRFEADTAVLETSIELAEQEQISSSSLGDGVLFANVSRGGYYYPLAVSGEVAIAGAGVSSDIACIDCYPYPSAEQPIQLLILGGLNEGRFDVGRLRVEDTSDDNAQVFYGTTSIHASDTRALLVGPSEAAVIDATTPSSPKIQKRIPLIGPAQSVDVKNNTALLALGQQGVQWIQF